MVTVSSGANRAISRCQLPITDIGQITSVGSRSSRGLVGVATLVGEDRDHLDGLAQAHVVGEYRTHPSPPRWVSHSNPRCWYGRNVASARTAPGSTGGRSEPASAMSSSQDMPDTAVTGTGASGVAGHQVEQLAHVGWGAGCGGDTRAAMNPAARVRGTLGAHPDTANPDQITFCRANSSMSASVSATASPPVPSASRH